MSLRLKPLVLLLISLPMQAHASLMPAHLIDGFANFISWIVLIILPIGFIALFWFVHIWPDTVAKRRQHPQRDAIHALCVLSLFFGGLLWPFAYLWAYTRPTMYKLAYGTDRYTPVEDQAGTESESSKP